ncbi:MFS transporter [uncultured Selenomonas sp.]|uniref:MFS transporter n=1 Tax=uncultured Selenomonas sp. TaxID=159275 RepID=UPI0028058A30|nr:MFS transporter [uncultured Selenomonas sp.]
MTSLLLAVIYLAFIGLGLPDSLLGAAWPAIQPSLGVPLSYAGIISMIIALGTVVSSLQSDRLTLRLGTGRVTAISVGMTAAALLGFSLSGSFCQLCLWAIPYGLGAGSVDAALNNYVALHYKSRHMSWLHCMWGVGAAAGPYLMGQALTGGAGWAAGYATVAGLQALLTLLLLCSLPLWQKRPGAAAQARPTQAQATQTQAAQTAPASVPATQPQGVQEAEEKRRPLPLAAVLRIRGVREVMLAFFCYCAVEQTCGLWASSFLHLGRGMSAERAAGLAALFFLGITAGRAVSGFLTLRLSDARMIRLGQLLLLLGTILLLLPLEGCAFAGLLLAGLGCAPIYPCIIHATPSHFGKEQSQAIIGVEMAAAYIGTMLMPPLFGVLAGRIAVTLLPLYLLALLALMTAMTERLERKTGQRARP